MKERILKRFDDEISALERELKTELPKEIQRAREFGDLRENAEYQAAKERQTLVQARIAGIDPALEEASADLGASEWVTLRKVLLPQLAPGILGGALLAFVISMDDLVITYFVSGTGDTTLPVFIFGMIRRGVKPEINAIATLIILASVVIAALGLWLRSRKTD